MNKERIVAEIMKECEKDGEPVTRKEAEKMAEMEIKFAEQRHYEKSEKPRKPSTKERKIDENKKRILNNCRVLLEGMQAEITSIKTETELSFIFNDEEYTLKLIKHRKGE